MDQNQINFIKEEFANEEIIQEIKIEPPVSYSEIDSTNLNIVMKNPENIEIELQTLKVEQQDPKIEPIYSEIEFHNSEAVQENFETEIDKQQGLKIEPFDPEIEEEYSYPEHLENSNVDQKILENEPKILKFEQNNPETEEPLTTQEATKPKRVQKRWSKKTIMDKIIEGPPPVKVIKITDIKALVSKPKKCKASRKSQKGRKKKFETGSGNCLQIIEDYSSHPKTRQQATENWHSKTENSPNFVDNFDIKSEKLGETKKITHEEFQSFEDYSENSKIKTEKDIEIHDINDHAENFKTQESFQKNFQFLPQKSESIQICQMDLQNFHSDPQNFHSDPLDFQSDPHNFPSSSQIKQDPEYFSKSSPENIDESSSDTSDPTYNAPQDDSDENSETSSDENNTKKNYKYKNEKFVCVHCNMQFKLLKNFESHECLICKECKKIFTTRRALNRHVENIHTKTDEIFECKDCKKIFKAREYLEAHIKSHDKTLECENCGKKFGNVSRLNEHRLRYKNPEKLICKICERKFSSRSSLKFHMRIHDVDRVKHLKCEECSFTTDDNRTLVKHRKSHAKKEEKYKTSTDWLKCEKCPAKLKNKQSLNNHMYYVHSVMSFQCNLCNVIVKTERNLKRHWKSIHENEKK